MKHRALVYCDDSTPERWGWWCTDCPDGAEPYTDVKASAERMAYRHDTQVQVVSGSSRATLRKAS